MLPQDLYFFPKAFCVKKAFQIPLGPCAPFQALLENLANKVCKGFSNSG